MKQIIYYTDSQLNPKTAEIVRKQLLSIGLPIISSSLEPLDFGENRVFDGQRGYETMFKQILDCLERATAEIIFFCEHDNLMHPSHFDFTPPDGKFYYDHNWWKIREDGLAVHWDADQVSGLCCSRDSALKYYRSRVATFDKESFDRKFEPLSGEGSESWKADFPSLDIRHNHNLTYNKWRLDHFRKKDTALNFEESTLDKIDGWSLSLADIY